MQTFKRIVNKKFLVGLFILSILFFISGLNYNKNSLYIFSYSLFFLEWLIILIETLKNRFNQRTFVIMMLLITPPIGVIFYLLKRSKF